VSEEGLAAYPDEPDLLVQAGKVLLGPGPVGSA
jgi:hypothetical protein